VLCLFARYPDLPAAKLQTARSRLRVSVDDANVFNRLNALVQHHTDPEETILATPDAPAVSFLSQRRPLNGVMYEFFREEIYADLESLKKQLTDEGVNIVVINERPSFSRPVSSDFREVALADFELLESIGSEQDDGSAPSFSVYKRRLVSNP
jgi:hypothetical protein